MNIDRALQVDGWMITSELQWLAEQAEKHYNIVEVGSWQGRSTRAIADHTPGTVWAVDTWKGSEEHQEELAKHEPDWLLNRFKRNMSGLSNYHIIQMESVKAAEFLSDRKFDLIFLDASHDYESVKADILAWRPLLSPGGLFCGHDYGDGCHGIGVKKAVNELIGPIKIGQNEIWYIE